MTRRIALGLLPATLALGVGCDDRDHADNPDLYVVSSNPGDLQSNVSSNIAIIVRFSTPVAPDSYTGNSQIILVDQQNSQQPITIQPTLSQGASEFITITPVTPLATNITYGVAVREFVNSAAGERITVPYAMRFSTGPTVVAIPGFPPFLAPPTPPPPPGAPGTFTATGSLVTRVDTHEATRLQNGNVLITGGLLNAATVLRQAQVYNSTAGTWRTVPNGGKNGLNFRRLYHTQTLLDNGQVLITGGTDGTVTHDTAELYDPLNDTFTVLANRMVQARLEHQAVKMDNGNVLICGGVNAFNVIQNTMEVYDVSAGTFTPTQATMTIPRERPTAIRQTDGRVLIVGGQTYANSFGFFTIISVNSGETYSPTPGTPGVSGSIQPCGNRMSTTRWWHSMTEFNAGAASGLIAVIGGSTDNPFQIALQNSEIYDYQAFNNTGGFQPIAQSMARARWDHEEVLLASQKILVTGGFTSAFPTVCPITLVTELFDPFGNGSNVSAPYRGVDQSGLYSLTKTQLGVITALPQPPLVSGLGAHSSTLLLNGTVLLAGGQDCAPGPVSVSLCTIYSP